MGGDGEWADFVVEKTTHGEPVERLIAASANAAVVHVRRDGYAQALLAASESHVTYRYFLLFLANLNLRIARLKSNFENILIALSLF